MVLLMINPYIILLQNYEGPNLVIWGDVVTTEKTFSTCGNEEAFMFQEYIFQ